MNGELLGVTIWRIRDGQDEATAERATADTLFTEGERFRFSIEAPRMENSYLYVIDREVYADGATSAPYLVFPSQSTPGRGNVVTAGKPVFVPAQRDEFPYFILERARKDQIGEKLTVVLSPKPLRLPLGAPSDPIELDRAQVARWEKQWGGRVELREDPGGAGKPLTAAEREADRGERRLVRNDPLPQTIYLIKGKSRAPIMLDLLLRIAREQ